MIEKIPFVPLKDIAEITQGINLKSSLAKSLSKRQQEEQYGLKENDVVIRRDIYAKGKKIAAVINHSSEKLIPGTSSLIIRPDISIVNPVYLKAFLEFIPSDKALKELNISNQKKLLSKGSLSKLKIPLPSLQEQINMTSNYEKVQTVEFYDRYRNPITEQYNSLKKFFWSYYN